MAFFLFILIVLVFVGWAVLRRRFYQSAADAYYSGDYAHAYAVYTRMTKFYPRDTMIYRYRALVAMRLDDTGSALADLSRAIDLNPRDISLREMRALCYNAIGDFEQALADCNSAIQIEPEQPDVYISRAFIYAIHNRLDEADADCDTAEERLKYLADIDENFGAYSLENLGPDIAYNVARLTAMRAGIIRQRGDVDEAIRMIDTAIAQHPETASFYTDRAEFLIVKGAYDRALADIETAHAYHEKQEVPSQFITGHSFEDMYMALKAITSYQLGDKETSYTLWHTLINKNDQFKSLEWTKYVFNWDQRIIEIGEQIIKELEA